MDFPPRYLSNGIVDEGLSIKDDDSQRELEFYCKELKIFLKFMVYPHDQGGGCGNCADKGRRGSIFVISCGRLL